MVMQPGEKTTLHHHDQTVEIYIIQSGKGYLTIDGVKGEVEKGMRAVIPVTKPHKLVSIGNEPLVLDVLAKPAFDPRDEIFD